MLKSIKILALNSGKLEKQQKVGGVGDLYATWYPTVEATLLCLSKLYLSVNTGVFEGLAEEAVRLCLHSLLAASQKFKVICQVSCLFCAL